jgi:hypothetical protein
MGGRLTVVVGSLVSWSYVDGSPAANTTAGMLVIRMLPGGAR